VLNYWDAPAVSRHHVESVNSRRAQYRVETFIIYDCSFRASFTSIVELCMSGTNGPARNLGKFTWCPVCVRQERYHLVDSDIFTRDGYQNGPGDRHLREDNREDGERKIVMAKDFKFSPRKESAAESTLPFPHMCMHYACTVALREKCLGSRKARGAVALSLFASLSPFLSLCMRRYQSCIKCAGVCVCRYRGSRCAQLCWRP